MNSSKKFFLISSLFFPIIFWFKNWSIIVGSSCLIIAFLPNKLRESLFKPINIVASLIGELNRIILMAIIFYTIFTPIALWRRLRGKDTLRLKLKNERSYWIKADSNDFDFTKPY